MGIYSEMRVRRFGREVRALRRSLASPRGDAPTQLPDPADSGFHCDDDPRFMSAAVDSAEPVAHDWQRDRQPVASTLRGFQELALLKALVVARGRDRPQIRREYLAATTRGAAHYFIRKVAVLAQHLRQPAPSARRPKLRLPLLPRAPKRVWPRDPASVYRATPPP